MTTNSVPPIRIAMIGHAFMGRAHSQAWRTAPAMFDLPLDPQRSVIVGTDQERTDAAAAKLGWSTASTDWRAVVESDDVDVVDICTPGDSHAEIAIAALRAGKHVLCEKPLANTVEEAQAMAAAAREADEQGVRSMVGFTYRRVPAVALAHTLVAEGKLGQIRHVRAQYLQDWLVDPQAPMSWRLDKNAAGFGALGDIGAHIVDLTQFITGSRISEVCGDLRTFVSERPDGKGGTGKVSVDDAASFLATFDDAAMGVFEASRFATGRKNAILLEINGTGGSLAFDFEDMNVLWFMDATAPSRTQGFTRILVTESEHPYLAAWWPPGHVLGYEHGFSNQVADFLTAIAGGSRPAPSFEDGLQVQRVLEAVAVSAELRAWQEIPD